MTLQGLVHAKLGEWCHYEDIIYKAALIHEESPGTIYFTSVTSVQDLGEIFFTGMNIQNQALA